MKETQFSTVVAIVVPGLIAVRGKQGVWQSRGEKRTKVEWLKG